MGQARDRVTVNKMSVTGNKGRGGHLTCPLRPVCLPEAAAAAAPTLAGVLARVGAAVCLAYSLSLTFWFH